MNPYWLILVFPLLAQFFMFLHWLHRHMRDEEIQRAFVRDVATNHLPHVYQALRLIDVHLGIALDEPPPLRFIEFDGSNKHRS